MNLSDYLIVRHSFSVLTVRELRERQGLDQQLVMSGTRINYLTDKYALSVMEIALIFTAETVDKYGRLAA